MLNFFTTSNGFRSTLPVVSNLTAMNVWDGVCMCFIYASLLEFVCVNYMGRKRPQHNAVYRPGENPVTQVIQQYHTHATAYIHTYTNTYTRTVLVYTRTHPHVLFVGPYCLFRSISLSLSLSLNHTVWTYTYILLLLLPPPSH